MADEPAMQAPKSEVKTKIFKLGLPLKSLMIGFLKRLKLPVHDAREEGFELTVTDIYKKLSSEIDFGTLKNLNNRMVQTEVEWEGIWQDKESNSKSAEGYWKKAIALYSDGHADNAEFAKGFGPYKDALELNKEIQGTQYGTGIDRRAHITVNTEAGSVTHNYVLPKEEKFQHGDWEYSAGFIGGLNADYWRLLENDITIICDEVMNKQLANEKDPKLRDIIRSNITSTKNLYIDAISKVISAYFFEFENGTHYGNIHPLYEKFQSAYNDLHTNVYGKLIDQTQMFYNHTYKIIKPYFDDYIEQKEIKEITEDGGLIYEEEAKKVRYRIYFDPETNPHVKELLETIGEILTIKQIIDNSADNDNEKIKEIKKYIDYTVKKILEDIEKKNQDINKILDYAETAVQETKVKLVGYIRNKKDAISRLDREIKETISSKIAESNITQSLWNDLNISMRRRLISHVDPIYKAVMDLLKSINNLQLKNKRAPQPFFLLNDNSRQINDLGEFAAALENIDNQTFLYHVTSSKNDFAEWIRYAFKNSNLTNDVRNARTRNAMLEAIKSVLQENKASFKQKVNELFRIMNAELQNLKFRDKENKELENEINKKIQKALDEISKSKAKIEAIPNAINENVAAAKRKEVIQLYFLVYDRKNPETPVISYFNYWRSKLGPEVISDRIESIASQPENLHFRIDSLLSELQGILEDLGYSKSEINAQLDEFQKKIIQIIDDDNLRAKIGQRSEANNQKNISYNKLDRLLRLNERKEQIKKIMKVNKPDHSNFEKFEKEQGWGLDENGMPLEVGDGKTKFGDYLPPNGEIMIDNYKRPTGKNVRKVDPRFIGECDLLDVATWIYVSYDAYRDDMRDGRYHKDSMSITEYLMKESPPLDWDGFVSPPNFETGEHAKVRVKLNKAPNQAELRPSSDPVTVDMEVKPTHINPAFDFRTKEKSIHMGRLYYYGTQEDVEHQELPTITTRGAAMYILHNVITHAKYIGGTGDKAKEGIKELFEQIGEQTSGFDIGPNIKRWGKNLTWDPFKPNQVGG